MNARLRAVKPSPKPAVRRFAESPGWAYRTEHNCCAYADAIAWLRRAMPSKWLMDAGALKPNWTVTERNAT